MKTLKTPVRHADEVGQLAQHLNQLARKLKMYGDQIAELAEQEQQRDLMGRAYLAESPAELNAVLDDLVKRIGWIDEHSGNTVVIGQALH